MADTVELKESSSSFEKHEKLAKELWERGNIDYQHVPITLTDSFRETVEINRGLAKVELLFLYLDSTQSLLKIFPYLKVVLEDRTVQMRLYDYIRESKPEFLYLSKINTLLMTSKATPAEDNFGHELGHHVASFFSEEDWLTLLASQPWKINEEGRYREASIDDLRTLEELHNAESVSVDEIPDWVYETPSGEKGKRYRHSNPLEMVAEVFADHYDEVLSLIRENRFEGKEGRRTVIKYLLGKLTS